MNIQHQRLRPFVADIFAKAGCQAVEAERIATHLVEANLVGHDSHGVIRVPTYVTWLKAGKVRAGQSIQGPEGEGQLHFGASQLYGVRAVSSLQKESSV